MNPDDRAWPARWDGHARAQRRRIAALPLVEKLAWLEEAQRLAGCLTGARHAFQDDSASRSLEFDDE